MVGQVATVVLVVLGLLWIPFMKHISGQLYQYLQSVQAYICPPIAAVFLLGVFWKRVNARGAHGRPAHRLRAGDGAAGAGAGRPRDLGGLVLAYADMNFLHFAVLLFAICVAVMVRGQPVGAAAVGRTAGGIDLCDGRAARRIAASRIADTVELAGGGRGRPHLVDLPRLKGTIMDDAATARLLDMLLTAQRLKTTPRTGWHQRGVPRARKRGRPQPWRGR